MWKCPVVGEACERCESEPSCAKKRIEENRSNFKTLSQRLHEASLFSKLMSARKRQLCEKAGTNIPAVEIEKAKKFQKWLMSLSHESSRMFGGYVSQAKRFASFLREIENHAAAGDWDAIARASEALSTRLSELSDMVYAAELPGE